jgi:hypothetical protein
MVMRGRDRASLEEWLAAAYARGTVACKAGPGVSTFGRGETAVSALQFTSQRDGPQAVSLGAAKQALAISSSIDSTGLAVDLFETGTQHSSSPDKQPFPPSGRESG